MAWGNALRSGEAIIQTLWVGALWTVGYLVAPALFAHLDVREAGRIAGELFSVTAWLSVVCGALLLIARRDAAQQAGIRKLRPWLIIVMLVLIAAGEWGVRPLMEASRAPDGTPGEGFALWHGVSAMLYLFASVTGLLLVAAGADRTSVREDSPAGG